MKSTNEIITRLLSENNIQYHIIGGMVITCQLLPNGAYDCINWTGSGVDQLITWLKNR